MKRILASLASACISPAFAWVAGFDFDHRGFEAVAALAGTIFFFGWQFAAPWWEKIK
jgi:hypothetical protein